MTGDQHEHSLRNEQVGQAYMVMLDVYEKCRLQGMTPVQISQEIEKANPWGACQTWRLQAWLIARREFYEDYTLPPPKTTDVE